MLMFKEAINKRPSCDNALSNESSADVHNRCRCHLGAASACGVIFEISHHGRDMLRGVLRRKVEKTRANDYAS